MVKSDRSLNADNIVHHPDETLLMEHAAGTLPNALGLLLACHLDRCQMCRSRARSLEVVGGELFSDVSGVAVSDALLGSILNELPAHPIAASQASSDRQNLTPSGGTAEVEVLRDIPRPLRRFVTQGLETLPWKTFGNIATYNLPLTGDGLRMSFHRIKSSAQIPVHTHRGHEYTMVLEGGFTDQEGHYLMGDFVVRDGEHEHQPRADDDGDCIVVAVLDAPLKLTGPVGRLLNPFMSW